MDVVKTASFLFELISVTTKVGFVSSGLDFRIFFQVLLEIFIFYVTNEIELLKGIILLSLIFHRDSVKC